MARRLQTLGCWWLPILCGGWPVGSAQSAEPERERGHPFVENFAAREYQADSQMWSAAQDAQGVMYFGNKGVVIEYDGVTWRKIFVSDDNYVIRGLAFDPAGDAVFVGGLNNLGFLKNGPDGGKVFASLLERLPAEDRHFGPIYRVCAAREGVVFVAAKQVMRWRDGAFKVWKFPVPDRLQSECIAGRVHVQSQGLGLLRLEGDDFVPSSDDPFFRATTLTGIAAGSVAGELIVGTRHDGLFVLKDGAPTPLASNLNAFFKSKEVRRLTRLRDGALLVTTGAAGVVALDADNRFLDRWDEASGLQNQTALDLLEDREGGVWLCLYAGVTRVQTGLAMSLFDAANGLKRASIHDLQRWRDTFYVATDSGLYRLVAAEPAQGQAARCERVPGMDADYWALCATPHGLLVAGLGVIYQFDGSGPAALVARFPYSGAILSPSRWRPGRVWIGTRNELRSLRYDDAAARWADEGAVPGVGAEIHALAETAAGDLWAGSNDHGLLRVRFGPDDADGRRGAAGVTQFLGQPGPLHDAVEAGVSVAQNGDVIAYTHKGLYRFDPLQQNFRPANEYGASLADGSFGVDRFAPDPHGGVWLTGRLTRGPWLAQQGGWAQPGDADGKGRKFARLPHRIFDRLTALDRILPEENGAVWMASPDGIVRLEGQGWLRRQGEPPGGFATLIRRATATARAAASAPPSSWTLPAIGARLDAAHNSVQFELAANTFAPGADVLYQTRLRGFGDRQWSALTPRAREEYTNLAEGDYVFEARAQNADGVLGQIARLSFAVAPPWQRTGWAYALYAALAALGVAGILRWRLRQWRAANARLETLVATRTDELRAHQLELERARDAAEAANRAKSAFLANMSHELRTPLNAVLGYTQILLNDPEQSPRNRERLAVVGQSGKHLLTMINEVLDISKIEAGKLKTVPADFSLGALLEDVGAAFAPRLAEKGLRFIQERGDSTMGMVHADAGKLRQVLFNLLGNAVKFTQRGEVRLVARGLGDDRWRFEVSDTGTGISEAELASIFVAFHQGSAGKQSAQGTGLGLAISQRLVELLGGELRVESEVGRGSRFWFELRLPPALNAEGLVVLRRADGAPSKISGFRGAARRVLVADDEPVNRRILREMLEPLGFEIEEAADGAQTLASCARQAPAALLLDLRMEPVDGFEVARRLREEKVLGRDIKIIAISASVFESDRQQAIDAGCDEFLPKPFEEAQLLAALGRLLALEWVFEAAEDAALAGPPLSVEEGAIPPEAEIEAMLELSRRGDIRGIKKRLGALAMGGDGRNYAGFVRGLEPLVASYQMDRIRDALARYKQDAENVGG